MKSKLIAFCLAVFVFTGSSMTAQAAVCPNAPDGVHHFEMGHQYCKYQNMGRTVDLGTHRYLYAYDGNGNPVYKNNCRLTQTHLYYRYTCYWCGLEDTSASHEHIQEIEHSIAHN